MFIYDFVKTHDADKVLSEVLKLIKCQVDIHDSMHLNREKKNFNLLTKSLGLFASYWGVFTSLWMSKQANGEFGGFIEQIFSGEKLHYFNMPSK